MRLALALCGAALAAVAFVSTAEATTLTGNVSTDNSFKAYLSTDDNTLGTEIGSGSDWTNASPVSGALAAGVTYYLHIVALNAGAPAADNPDALLGQFHLDDTLHKFVNNTQDLLTNVADWAASAVGAADPWSAPSGPLQTFGLNSDTSTIWFKNHGLISGIDPNAAWVWSDPDNGTAAFFSTKIVATTPIPASLPLLGTALVGLGFMARRKRQATAA